MKETARRRYSRRESAESFLPLPAEAVFDHLDDHHHFSSHMEQSSMLMAGSRMTVSMDGASGRQVGSRIFLAGRLLGIPLAVSEAVTERQPPWKKAWETDGEPRLLVIGPYRMGFSIRPAEGGCITEVFLDYCLPSAWFSHVLGLLFGKIYARWCVRSVLAGVAGS